MNLKKSIFTPFLILAIALTCNVNSLLSMEEDDDEEETPLLTHTGGGTLPSQFLCGASTCKGRKPTMEDTYTALPGFDGDDRSFFGAVYDGHSGPQVSQYAAANLHTFLATRLHEERTVPASLHDAFDQTNANVSSDSAGTTATVAFIREQFLHIAWVGDSRFIVVRDGKVSYETEDHTPRNPNEKSRIIALGGQTHTYGTSVERIGGLMVSRSLGDKAIKRSNAGGVKDGVISSTPQIMCLEFGDDDIGVIASDGLWEGSTSFEVADLLDKLLKRKITATSTAETEESGNDEQLKQLARQLCTYAYAEKSSRDNIAVLLFRRFHGPPPAKQGAKDRLANRLWTMGNK